jgi:hypothetical protein
MDPVAAEEALASVQRQREQVASVYRLPWWVYPVTFVWLSALVASWDWGDEVGNIVLLVLWLPLVTALLLSRWFPGIARALRISVRPPSSAVTIGFKVAIVIVIALCVATVVLVHFGHGLLADLGAPAWVREHPGTTFGVPMAFALTALQFLANRSVSARVSQPSR